MNPLRGLALGLLAGGIALTVYGVNASHSVGSEITRVFTGNPSDHSMTLIIGGVVLIVAAAAVFMGGGKKG